MRTLAAVGCALLLAACAGTRQSQKAKDQPSFSEQIVKYEVSFRPSDYDPDPAKHPQTTPAQPAATDTAAADTESAVAELTQGFRVQIYSSLKIDDARAKKAEAETAFPEEWFYLEYDPPAYKIRAGTFLTRFAAERFVKLLLEKGFPGAWTVPARVFRNPPEPPTSP